MPAEPLPPSDVLERLKRKWLHALDREWAVANRVHLNWKLRRPVFILHQGTSRLGFWNAGKRVISISEDYIWNSPWAEVVETLRHETAHQWVDEVAEAAGEKPHGASFQKACRMLGISSAASGRVRKPPGGASDAILRRIRRLLALAGSTNENEARSAAAKARELMLRYNLDRVEEDVAYTYRRLGRAYGAVPHERHLIGAILAEFFFVEVIWTQEYDPRRDKWRHRLEVCGTEENLAMAEYVHEFLSERSERLWQATMAKNRNSRYGGLTHGMPFTRRERKDYLDGLLGSFRESLRRQGRKLNDERSLVWVGDPRLQDYFKRRHPIIEYGKGSENRPSLAWLQGRQAGRKLKIHRPISEGKAEDKGRLLT